MSDPTMIRDFSRRVQQLLAKGNTISLEEMRLGAVQLVMRRYGTYMYPGIRDLPLDQPIREKTNLREMGCDGGFDPIPPQQIEFDVSLTPLERFVALIRAGVQFYAYSGPAKLQVGKNPATRWGFVHLDQTGAPNTMYYGLHQDMVHYLTDVICQHADIPLQTWMQRGDGSHIQQLIARPSVGEDLLLNAFFGEPFPDLFAAIDHAKPGHFNIVADLSDQIDNAHLCEFPDATIQQMEDQFAKEVRVIP